MYEHLIDKMKLDLSICNVIKMTRYIKEHMKNIFLTFSFSCLAFSTNLFADELNYVDPVSYWYKDMAHYSFCDGCDNISSESSVKQHINELKKYYNTFSPVGSKDYIRLSRPYYLCKNDESQISLRPDKEEFELCEIIYCLTFSDSSMFKHVKNSSKKIGTWEALLNGLQDFVAVN